MHRVISLDEYKNQRTVEAIQCLLRLAMEKKLKGSAICFITTGGDEEAIFTGYYKTSPAKGVNAAMRLSWKLTQAQDAKKELG
jgi:hypothetical protein